jgi:hypothetical protein
MPSLVGRARRLALRLSVDVSGQDAGGASFVESTHTLNLSGGGVCFESHQQLLVGSRLVLRIELPGRLRRHFGGRSEYRARCVVCRVEHFQGSGLYRVGARLLGGAPTIA